MTYRADIDGLRAIAVLAVVGYHAFPTLLPGGFVGVDVFFVISGFLITSIIRADLRDGKFSVRRFYARRIRRIFPALAVMLLACLGVGWFLLYADRYAELGKHVAAGAAFVANLVYWSEADYFDSDVAMKPLLHLWSLAVEEQFYLLWPLLLWGLSRMATSTSRAIVWLLMMSLGWSAYVVSVDQTAAFYSPLTRFWELMAGAWLAYLDRSPSGESGPTSVQSVAVTAGLGLIAFAAFSFSSATRFPGPAAAIPVVGTALVIWAGGTPLPSRVLATRTLVDVGLVSYPLYLWHWPLLALGTIQYGVAPPVEIRAALMVLAFGLAKLTYNTIESPIRHGRRAGVAVAVLSSAMIALGVGGYVVLARDGIGNRPVSLTSKAEFAAEVVKLRVNALGEPTSGYRLECDFKVRNPIASTCAEGGPGITWFLWGDSFAQALAPGLRRVLPAGTRLAQVATSACDPAVDQREPVDHICAESNRVALDAIGRLKPALVVLTQMDEFAKTDWSRIAAEIRARGGDRVIVVGPAPRWVSPLPLLIEHQFWGTDFLRLPHGFIAEIASESREAAARIGSIPGVEYVPLFEELCSVDGCLGRVPDGGALDVFSFDEGHLTLPASEFVARTILLPAIRRPGQ